MNSEAIFPLWSIFFAWIGGFAVAWIVFRKDRWKENILQEYLDREIETNNIYRKTLKMYLLEDSDYLNQKEMSAELIAEDITLLDTFGEKLYEN